MSTIAVLAERFGVARIEAARLAGHALGTSTAWVVAHDREPLSPRQAEHLSALLRARSEGVPLAYITGMREFYGLAFQVTPHVLIPRPETELLVDLALEHLRSCAVESVDGDRARIARRPRVLDLGTGSGAVAIAIAVNCPAAEVWASDRSAGAIALAGANAQKHDAPIRLVESDWFGGLAHQRFDLIVTNPPYVAERDPHLEQGDVRFEPREALCGGSDGLAAIRSIVETAAPHLAPGGWLWLEHGYDQAAAVRRMLGSADWLDISSRRDLAGHERVSGARWATSG
jgi:release factor glutamine methyltransferase